MQHVSGAAMPTCLFNAIRDFANRRLGYKDKLPDIFFTAFISEYHRDTRKRFRKGKGNDEMKPPLKKGRAKVVVESLFVTCKEFWGSEYVEHHASLVAASHLLNANTVSTESVSIANSLLNKYVTQVPELYHPNYLTMNFHLLLYLSHETTVLEPGWSYSCFPLESLNGEILKLVHGTRWAEKQIATSIEACLGLPDVVSKLQESETKNRDRYLTP
ncbi:LOW QUALITY PROTEIN: Paired amphipathic helix protein pst2 [Frankliniella fusca]|uniref:Paired amphipathic helix protein pst2 n=1 Tax=Frankliniella fusca TaxID=407009 RepID=A0AAE1HHR9_9NEOP|nr:LOW QUALITY PROTEIN: Paired amphipathic helix protein pst2 [Frankliniella fusca]